MGGNRLWHRIIYQYPELQGSPGHYINVEYEAKHYIYSLGVVLLETLLWIPFVVSITTPAQSRGIYIRLISWPLITPEGTTLENNNCFKQRALQLGEANGSLPDRYASRGSAQLASEPQVTRNVWKSLAAEELVQINPAGAPITQKCLECQFDTAAEVLEAMARIAR